MTRAAIVVFCDVSDDQWHGERARVTAAESAVEAALGRDAAANESGQLPVPSNEARSVRVVAVLDVGTAALNGYLQVAPTPPGRKVWRVAGIDRDETGSAS